jgi:hypothetical protein
MGQIVDAEGRKRPDIAFVADVGGVRLYFRNDGISYVFSKAERPARAGMDTAWNDPCGDRTDLAGNPNAPSIAVHRIDMNFAGCNRHPRIHGEGELNEVNNFFLAHCPSGIPGVRKYAAIVYENVYDGIDLVCFFSGGRMKYNLVVRPGGDVGRIRMKYAGASSVALKDDGSVHIESPLGFVDEQAPVTYQEGNGAGDSTGGRVPVPSRFRQDGDEICFVVGDYDKHKTLVIDPWATYYGGGGDEGEVHVATDTGGNVIVSGYSSSFNLPVINAYQSVSAGNRDAFIVKFDGNGHRLWATYFGGSGEDVSQGVAADANGNIMICGYTSSSNLPTLNPFQSVKASLRDAFAAKFTSNGVLLWSTYYGGSGNDYARGVTVDLTGNIIIAGRTSSTNLPILNAFQPVNGVPPWLGDDAFVVKFSNNGTRLWATYYGGFEHDWANSVVADANGNVIISGETRSSDFPTQNAFQPVHAPGSLEDAFIVVFNSAGARVWATFFGGRQWDSGISVALDPGGNILMMGYTYSDDLPVLNAYQSANAGGWDAFLAKFSGSGALVWSTYFGGNSEDGHSYGGVAADASGSIFITGHTLTDPGATANQLFPTLHGCHTRNTGDMDAFIAKFNSSGTPVWSTLFGGSDFDVGQGIAVDASGDVIVAGETRSADLPVLNAFQSSSGGNSDAFVVKFQCTPPQTVSHPADTTVCAASDVVFRSSATGSLCDIFIQWQRSTDGGATWTNFGTVIWRNVGGALSDSCVIHAEPAMNGYQYRAVFTNACGSTATSAATLHVFVPPVVLSHPASQTLCEDSIAVFQASGSGASAMQWQTSTDGGTTWTDLAGQKGSPLALTATMQMNGNRFRAVLGNPCGVVPTDAATLTVEAKPKATLSANGPTRFCQGESVTLTAGAGPGWTYRWMLNGQDIAGATGTTCVVSDNGEYAVMVTGGSGCRDSTAIGVVVLPKPTASVSPTGPVRLCQGESAVLSATRKSDFSYQWMRDGNILSGDTDPDYVASFPGLYQVIVVNRDGCRDTSRAVQVTVYPAPLSRINGPASVCVNADAAYGLSTYGGFSTTWKVSGGTPLTALSGDSIRVRWSSIGTGQVQASMMMKANGCVRDTMLLVNVSTLLTPDITPGGPVTLCAGDSIILDAGAGYASYRWSTGDTTRCITVRNAGAYTVLVGDGNGCGGSSLPVRVTLNAAPEPSITLIGGARFCHGDSVLLDAGTGYRSYRWSTGALTRRIAVREEGRYSVAVSDSNGCDHVAQPVDITLYPSPIMEIAGNRTTCVNMILTYQAIDSGSTSYTWSAAGGSILSGAGTRRITVQWTAPGSCSLRLSITSADGCVRDTTIGVVVGSSVTPTIVAQGKTTFCSGDSVRLDAGSDHEQYRWSTGDTTHAIVIRSSGEYTVTATDSNGCTGTSLPLRVTVNAAPDVSIIGPGSACPNRDVSFSVPDRSGNVYDWTSNRGTLISGGGTHAVLIRWSDVGPDMVRVRVTSAGGCARDTSLIVLINTSLMPTIVPDHPPSLCEGDSIVLSAGGGYASYHWSTGDTTRTITVRSGGNFSVRVTDANGCGGTSQPVAVVVNPLPEASITGPKTICLNTDAAFAVANGPGNTYLWAAGRGTIRSGNGSDRIIVRWDREGLDTVRVTIMTATGCRRDTMLSVAVNASLQVVIAPDRPPSICEGESLSLDMEAGYASYEWRRNGTMIGTSSRVIARLAGDYEVTVIDSAGCTGMASITVMVHPLPQPTVAGPREMCEGDSVTLTATSGFASYLWVGTGATSRMIVARVGGTYMVQVTDSNGCTNTSPPHLLTVHPRPAAPVIVRSGDTLTAHHPSAFSYQWLRGDTLIPGEMAGSIIATQDGVYAVRIVDSNGCVAQSAAFDFKGGMVATATVQLPVIEGAPGERVIIPIILAASQYIKETGARDFTAAVRFNKTLLYPVEGTPLGTTDDSTRMVTIQVSTSEARNPLAQLEFLATLGNADRTPIHFESFDFNGAQVNVTTIDGEFRLKICREGGDRLVDASGRFGLKQNHPNPFNAMTSIEYEVVEAGPVRLAVLDMLGRQVATLVDASVAAGKYRVTFDAQSLTSGMYAAILTTSTQSTHILMRLLK